MAVRAGATSSVFSRISHLPFRQLFAASYSIPRDHPYRNDKPDSPDFYRFAPPKNFGVHIVPPQTVYIVERDGKYLKTLNSGVHFLNPFTDRIAHVHSVKELLIIPSPIRFMTLDRFGMGIDFLPYIKIVDPLLASYEVANPILATMHVLEYQMRSEVCRFTLDKLLQERDIICENVLTAANADTTDWGVKCLRCEIGNVWSKNIYDNASRKFGNL